MYDTLDDIQGYAIHTIKNGEKEITISCLRNYDEEISNCPLCANKNFQKARLYLSLYNEDDNEIQIWTRGKQIVPEIMKTFTPIQNNVCGGRVKITRKGAKGDKYTKYIMELIDNDGLTLEELIENVGEPTNPMGTLIKDYSFDELTEYNNTGKLPDIEIEQPTQVNVAYRGNNFNNNNTNNNLNNNITNIQDQKLQFYLQNPKSPNGFYKIPSSMFTPQQKNYEPFKIPTPLFTPQNNEVYNLVSPFLNTPDYINQKRQRNNYIENYGISPIINLNNNNNYNGINDSINENIFKKNSPSPFNNTPRQFNQKINTNFKKEQNNLFNFEQF
jgi:hypothetical protein